MKRIATALPVRFMAAGDALAPFGEAPASLPVLGRPLRDVVADACAAAGLGPVVEAAEGPCVAIGAHTWVTPALLRAFVAACPPGGGQLAIRGPFLDQHRPLQDLADEGDGARVPVAVVPDGDASPARLAALPPVFVDLKVRPHAMKPPHPAFAHAQQGELPLTDRAVHTITHWSHLLRVNHLALLAILETRRRAFEAAGPVGKAWEVSKILARARWPSRPRVAAALGERGRGCKVHPTAVVEACLLGDGVEIGPHAVVRGCWLGDGVTIGEHAEVNFTVAHPGAHLGRGVMANLCVLLPGAFVSAGWGFQACLFGRDAFIAMGACFYDLSFGGEIRVTHRGARTSAGTHFLGVCVGHGAKVGPNVIVGYGEAIPSGAFLVADPGRIFRRIPEQLPDGPVACVDGEIRAVGRGRGSGSPQG